ncbi:RNA 2',3'-cyclic phosphodiesterase [Ruegeria denitrificans]|uniref:RNA 2',3'-cyclic phosphodiesterase n=1 Tax=Ruegeria denitrificans TaxID=1715692 RepID=UPI00071DB321
MQTAFQPLQRTIPVGRPLPSENLHLTLAFLDDQSEQVLQALDDELLALSAEPFVITFTRLERFGRVVAVGVNECEPLLALHRKVKAAARRAGIMLPRRRFRPHVTIARLKSSRYETAQPVSGLCPVTAVPDMQVTSLALFESILRPEGARHHVLAQYTLN